MKKRMSLFLATAVLMLGFCACQPKSKETNSDETLTTAESTVEETPTTAESTTSENQVQETLAEKLLREIEGAYREERESTENSSQGAMADVDYKYTQKWKQIADEYYQKILTHDVMVGTGTGDSSVSGTAALSEMKNNWEQYYKQQCDSYEKVLGTIYGGGSLAGIMHSSYRYEMQKEWALELVEIYQHL